VALLVFCLANEMYAWITSSTLRSNSLLRTSVSGLDGVPESFVHPGLHSGAHSLL